MTKRYFKLFFDSSGAVSNIIYTRTRTVYFLDAIASLDGGMRVRERESLSHCSIYNHYMYDAIVSISRTIKIKAPLRVQF